MDVFGPWTVLDRPHTRRHNSGQKRWDLLFTCMASRAVHVEVLPAMDTPTFRQALQRFLALRGSCSLLRSDRGTNLLGAFGKDVDEDTIHDFLHSKDCRWLPNPPHASHFGGVWERKIGQIRRALEGAMKAVHKRTCLLYTSPSPRDRG